MTDHLDAALRYAARGWQIFPCHTPTAGGCSCGHDDCESQGKHPRVAWKSKATADVQTIKNWWKRWPDANIGIATGARSGIVVLDVDGEDGAATVAERGIEAGPQATTGRGQHRYLAHPGQPVKNFVKRDGLDMRGDGGYVVAPPSLHPSGKRYTWVGDTEALALPATPAWLLEMIKTPEPTIVAAPVSQSTRTLAYAGVAFERELLQLSQSVNGTRNRNLNASALKLGHIVGAGWLQESIVEQALLTTALALGLPKHEAEATIRSGITAGKADPTVLEDRPLEHDPALGLKGIKRKDDPPVVHWMERLVDAADYPGKVFDPLMWAVPGLLPEGCFLFAGAPKTGKSWVALQIALAVATGGVLFGKIQVEQADVLYLDLESNQRRMKSRLSAMIGDEDWPSRGSLMITNEIDRLPDLVDRLDEWMVRKPTTRLIVIDIFENIRPDDTQIKNVNLYRLDYNAIRLLTRWADAYHVTILMLHHTNKMHSPDNQFHRISGSTGLTGATSGAWVMGHTGVDEYVLKVQGRDLENSDDLFLKWDSFLCRHQLVGNGALYSISDERKTVLAILDDDQEWSPRDLAAESGKTVTSIDKLLRALIADRLVEKSSYGKYVKVHRRITYGLEIGQTPQSGQSPQTPQTPQSSNEEPANSVGIGATLPNSAFGGGRVGDASESPKTPQNVNSVGSVRDSKNGSEPSGYDHDRQRESEVMASLEQHDYAGARRAANRIRSRKEQKRMEEMIREAQQ